MGFYLSYTFLLYSHLFLCALDLSPYLGSWGLWVVRLWGLSHEGCESWGLWVVRSWGLWRFEGFEGHEDCEGCESWGCELWGREGCDVWGFWGSWGHEGCESWGLFSRLTARASICGHYPRAKLANLSLKRYLQSRHIALCELERTIVWRCTVR